MEENQCKICSKKQGKYVCPRCNMLYCSLQCYQSTIHVQCSESFYRDCVLQEMKSNEGNPQSQQKMMEILKRFQESSLEDEDLDSDDEEEILELSKRLHDVNLDDADLVWEKLTPAERKEFEELLQSGDTSQLVPPWEPWWLFRMENKLVEEVDTEPETAKAPSYMQHCPKAKTNVPALKQISKAVPAVCVKYNIMNVLAAYCYMARYFNGEHHTMATEASRIVVQLSGNLSLNRNYDSAVTAVGAVSYEVINCTWLEGSTGVSQMGKDVECILIGPEDNNQTFYLQAALSDMHELMKEARRAQHNGPEKRTSKGNFTKKFVDQSFPLTVSTEKLKQCIKKLEYYISWSKDYTKEM